MKTFLQLSFRVLIVSSVLIIFMGATVCGQDLKIKENDEEIKSNLKLVSDSRISYGMSDNLAGPLCSVGKPEIYMIRYESGTPVRVVPSQPVHLIMADVTNRDVTPAQVGAIVNLVLIVPIAALGTVAAFSDDMTTNIAFGAAATVIAGVGIPVGSLLGNKTRRIDGVNGSLGLRITGWVAYGLTMADALAMLALSQQVDFTGGPVMSVVALGILSTTFMSLDNFQSVRQAKSMMGNRMILQPTIGYVRDMNGNRYNTIGVRFSF